MVNPALSGFGMVASTSFTSSNIHQANKLDNPLEGLSGRVNSLVAYYEKDGLSTRIAQRYRSRYMASVRNAWGDTAYTTIEPEKVVDFQVGYAFQGSQYKGLSVLFQINNLTNEAYRTMMSVDSGSGTVPGLMYPAIYEKYGRQYLLGLNYKF
jgi:iron complex outermembrane receptor protein